MKTKIVFILLLPLLVVFQSPGCKKPSGVEKTYSISLNNDSNASIFYLVSYAYPDTLIPDEYDKIRSCNANGKSFIDSKKKWQEVFSEDILGDTLLIFVFDKYPASQTEWQQIRSNYSILMRYEVSYTDLEQHNWQIYYP